MNTHYKPRYAVEVDAARHGERVVWIESDVMLDALTFANAVDPRRSPLAIDRAFDARASEEQGIVSRGYYGIPRPSPSLASLLPYLEGHIDRLTDKALDRLYDE